MNNMGWIHYNRGEREGAVALWQEVLTLNPEDREARGNLARAFNDQARESYQSGRRGEARAYWQRTLQVDPKNKAAKWNLAHLN